MEKSYLLYDFKWRHWGHILYSILRCMRVVFLLWPFHLCKLLISLWTCMWGCEGFIVMSMRIAVFWHVMLCSFLDTYEHCGRTCIPYVVGRRVIRRANSSTLKMKDAGRMLLRNVGVGVPNYKKSQPRRQ
jgi:hypothetical protein